MVRPSENKKKDLPTLDKLRPYAEVCGLPGAAFEQDGLFFNSSGFFVAPESCQPINDEKDKPLSEDYTEYNQVTLQESEPSIKKISKGNSIEMIYGEVL